MDETTLQFPIASSTAPVWRYAPPESPSLSLPLCCGDTLSLPSLAPHVFTFVTFLSLPSFIFSV